MRAGPHEDGSSAQGEERATGKLFLFRGFTAGVMEVSAPHVIPAQASPGASETSCTRIEVECHLCDR
jgi:hypothetical protein